MAQDVYSTFTDAERKQFDQCQTPDQISEFLRNLHGPAPESPRDAAGRFIPTHAPTPEEAAAKVAAAAAPHEFKQTVVIGGKNFDFVATSAESLQLQIDSAKAVAQQLTDARATVRTAEQETFDREVTEREFRLGNLSTAEYLKRTNAVEQHLESLGVDVHKLAGEQFTESWAAAGHAFQQSEIGRSWPGGEKNKLLLADKISAMGLSGTPSVESLEKAYLALKEAGTLFDGDVSQAEIEAMTASATPAEILAAWKDAQPDVKTGDARAANDAFLATFANGRSSSIFGK